MTTLGLSAITGVNSDETEVEIYGIDDTLEVVNDTVVFYVDTDELTGATEGRIRTATDWYDDAADEGGVQVGEDIANCLYLYDNDELEVLVVEAGDNIFRGPYADDMGAVSLSATIDSVEAGTASTEVTFTLNNIPDGAEIDLTDVDTATGVTMDTVTAPATTGTLENLSSLAQGDYTLTFTVTDAEGDTLATTTATLTIGEVSIDTISAPSVDGALSAAAPKATDVVNALVTSASAGDATMEVTGFDVAVTNKVVSDTYALVAGDTVQVTISLQTTEGNVLVSDLDVSGAAIQSVEPTIENQTSTSVDLVYTYTVPKTEVSTANISASCVPEYPAADATAPDNTTVEFTETQLQGTIVWNVPTYSSSFGSNWVSGDSVTGTLTVSISDANADEYELTATTVTKYSGDSDIEITSPSLEDGILTATVTYTVS